MAANVRRRKQGSTWLGPALGMGLGTAASGLGLSELAPLGYRAGQYLGDRFKSITGFGAYTVRSNVLYEGATVPYVRNVSATNGTIISHKEYIGDIYTSSTAGAFTNQSFPINPAIPETFEWLAQIACNYSEYTMEGLLFYFRSMSADALNSTNTALGTVIMATQYNSYEADFASKAEMESYQYAMSGRPSESMIHPVECDPHQSVMTQLFTRTTDVPQGDLRMYDIGRFQIATTGFQAASVNIGELWVTYQVCLLKPRLYASLGYYSDWYHRYCTVADTTNPLGTVASQTLGSSNNIVVGIAYPAANQAVLSFPKYPQPVAYKVTITWIWNGAAFANMDCTLSDLVNCTLLTGYLGANLITAPGTGRTGNAQTTYFFLKCNGLNIIPSIKLTIAAWSGNVQSCHVFVDQIPGQQ